MEPEGAFQPEQPPDVPPGMTQEEVLRWLGNPEYAEWWEDGYQDDDPNTFILDARDWQPE